MTKNAAISIALSVTSPIVQSVSEIQSHTTRFQ